MSMSQHIRRRNINQYERRDISESGQGPGANHPNVLTERSLVSMSWEGCEAGPCHAVTPYVTGHAGPDVGTYTPSRDQQQ